MSSQYLSITSYNIFVVLILGILGPSAGEKSNFTKFVFSISGDVSCLSNPHLTVTSLTEPEVNITVTMPRFADFLQVNSSVVFGQWKVVTLPSHTRLKKGGITNMGIVIKATGPIQVYLSNRGHCGGDGSVVLPVDLLGSRYLLNCRQTVAGRCLMSITAADNDTDVKISLAGHGGTNLAKVSLGNITYQPGETIHLTLQSFQTILLEDIDDVRGFIDSSNPISVSYAEVYSCNEKHSLLSKLLTIDSSIQCGYISSEQLLPVSNLGGQYLILPFSDKGDSVHITAAENDTNLVVERREWTSTFNLTATHGVDFYLSPGDFISIDSDKSLMVLQYSGEDCGSSGGDNTSQRTCPSLMVAPSITSGGSRYFVGHGATDTASFTTMHIVVRSREAIGLTFNKSHLFNQNDPDLNLTLHGVHGEYNLYKLHVNTTHGILLHTSPGASFLLSTPGVSVQAIPGRTQNNSKDANSATLTAQSSSKATPTASRHYVTVTSPTQLASTVSVAQPYKTAKPIFKDFVNNVLKLQETEKYNGVYHSKNTDVVKDSRFVVKDTRVQDGINLHQAETKKLWGRGGGSGQGASLDVTVIAVIISLATAVLLVIVCVVGFLMAEYVCRRELFRAAKVSPYIE